MSTKPGTVHEQVMEVHPNSTDFLFYPKILEHQTYNLPVAANIVTTRKTKIREKGCFSWIIFVRKILHFRSPGIKGKEMWGRVFFRLLLIDFQLGQGEGSFIIIFCRVFVCILLALNQQILRTIKTCDIFIPLALYCCVRCIKISQYN